MSFRKLLQTINNQPCPVPLIKCREDLRPQRQLGLPGVISPIRMQTQDNRFWRYG